MASTSESPLIQSAQDLAASSVNATAPTFHPLYQQIKILILQRLQSGECRPGEAIPSEMELASQFNVSQGTVRKAIDALVTDNLIVRKQGKGTFVATHTEQHVQYRFLKLIPDCGNVSEERPAQRNIIECKRVRASAEIAHILALRTGDAVIQVRRILSFKKTPTILEDMWLPGNAFKGLNAKQMMLFPGPAYAMYEHDFGVTMIRAEEKIRAVCPDNEQAELLNVSPQTPLLSVERIAFTYNNMPMELRRGLYRTDSHHYHNELN